MCYTIKKLLPTDLTLAKNLITSWLMDDEVLNPTIPDDIYLNDLLSKDTFHIFVALDNERVIGGLTAYELPMFYEAETEMFLYEIGVSEHYRQKGIAKKLIAELKQMCLSKGIKTIFVGTSTDNGPARQLYKASGAKMEEVSWFTYSLD